MKLTIEIDLPDAAEILNSGSPVPIARKGQKWSKSCLGEMCNKRGVYVIHHDGKIKYVGKTDGPNMYFGRRLRSEFREQSSRGKHNYPKLSKLKTPPEIMVHCYPVEAIEQRVKFNGESPRLDHMVAIFEMVMIIHLAPEFQQQLIQAVSKFAQKTMKKYLGKGVDPARTLEFEAAIRDILAKPRQKKPDKTQSSFE